jgi:hypothetical protein
VSAQVTKDARAKLVVLLDLGAERLVCGNDVGHERFAMKGQDVARLTDPKMKGDVFRPVVEGQPGRAVVVKQQAPKLRIAVADSGVATIEVRPEETPPLVCADPAFRKPAEFASDSQSRNATHRMNVPISDVGFVRPKYVAKPQVAEAVIEVTGDPV